MKRLLAAVLISSAGVANGDPVTVVFEGVITAENGGFPGTVGQPIAGSYVFESSTPPLVPGFYPNAVSGVSVDFASNTLDIALASSSLSMMNGAPTGDDYFVGGAGSGTLNGGAVGAAGFAILLLDPTGTMIGDTAITTLPSFIPPINFATFQLLDASGVPAFSANLTRLELAPSAVEVAIDVKPGSNPSPINLGSNGVTPVAVFGSAEFDATQIDTTSLEINGESAAVKVTGQGVALVSLADLDADGYLDAIVKFVTQGLAVASNAPVILEGRTLSGTPFMGEQPASDPVIVVP